MKIRNNPITIAIGTLLAVCILTWVITTITLHYHDKKIAVVDVVKLFNEYHMKKDLEKGAEVQLRYLSRVSDSLKLVISSISQTPKVSKKDLNAVLENYNRVRAEFEDAYEQNSKIVNQAVWKRLNPLLETYGKQGGFHVIIGATGKGSVLYMDKYLDQTDDLIEYVNKRYDEGN